MDIPHLMEMTAGVRVSYLASFLLAVILSIVPGNLIVRSVHGFIFRKITKSGSSRDFIQIEFKSPGAAWIGRSERVIYVFGLMFAQPGVITGVIILKAFFSWTDKFPPPKPEHGTGARTDRQVYVDMISNYHVYLVGNLVSLITGLVLGELGVFLFPALISWVVPLGGAPGRGLADCLYC